MKHLTTHLLLFLPFLLSNCASPAYNAKWKSEVAAHEAGARPFPTGPWTGTWASLPSGHTGPLRCIVSAGDDGEKEYEFHYWARWGKFFQGTFEVEYAVEEHPDGSLSVTGSQDLGPFGTYRHTGTLTEDAFHAEFTADKDKGTFDMTRPE